MARMIDADKLIDQIERKYGMDPMYFTDENTPEGRQAEIDAALIELLERAASEEAAPELRSKDGDRTKALEYLFNKISFCKSIGECYADAVNVEALEMALSALKKDIPRKPIKEKNEYTYRCPKCDSDVVGCGYYCWKCGQHLKWEDDDNGTQK